MENGGPTINTTPRARDNTIAPFSVIAIHDGYQAEMQVNHAFTWLHQSFRFDLRMSFSAWTFEKLVAALDIRAMSVRIGTKADVIIIATSSGEPLPEHIKRWLDSIICQQHKNRALVLALEPDAHSPGTRISTHCVELQQWAARWQASLICCADIHHPPSRQSILRLINDRFHHAPGADPEPEDVKQPENIPLTIHQIMNQNQTAMSPEQIQQVRDIAYHLWLQADRPSGKEIDFWLSAEKQVIQAAAEKAARETTLNAAPVIKSVVKKTKSTPKRTQ